MRKILFKILSLTLVISHILTITLRDISFAEQEQAQPSPSATNGRAGLNLPYGLEQDSPAPEGSASGKGISKEDIQALFPEENSSPSSEGNKKKILYAPQQAPAGSPPAIQLTGVSSFNFTVLQSFQGDPFTGKGVFSLPISVPTGRKGMQPSLALVYSSGAGNSWVGMGWGLDLGAIERSTKRGAPKYDSSDTFVYNSGSGASELVSTGGNEYRAKIEGGFMRFIFDGASWQVIDKSGTKYYFGESQGARIESGSRIYKWFLEKVIDTSGNYLKVTYVTDQNEIYPKFIEYAGNEQRDSRLNLNPIYRIEFILEARPDTLLNQRPGFDVVTAQRLSEIKVEANRQLVRNYKLEYKASLSNRSLLSAVTQYGSDGVSSLPAVTFEYADENAGWELSDKQLPAAADLGVYTRVQDTNNDGLPEIIKSVYHGDNQSTNRTFVGDGELEWSEKGKWESPVLFGWQAEQWRDNGIQTVDVNGDGWLDVLGHIHNNAGQCTYKKVFINNKNNGWDESAEWAVAIPEDVVFIVNHHVDVPMEYREHMGWVGMDVNGDGLSDFIRSRGGERDCFINTGNGWSRDSNWNMPDGDIASGSTQFCDLNADGLFDFFIIEGSGSRGYVNTGKGWRRAGEFNVNLGSFSAQSTQLQDINADGLSDIVISDSGQKRVYLNSGKEWLDRPQYSPPGGNIANLSSRLTDARGRLVPDVLINAGGENKIYTNKQDATPNLLVGVSNGLAGTVKIKYKPSTGFDNKGDDDISDLPFPVYVVDSVVVHDGANPDNPDVETKYEYKGGYFDLEDREFRGFRQVKQIDSQGSYTETYFKQDEVFKGRPEVQKVFDKSGRIYSQALNEWRQREVKPNVHFAYLNESTNFIYDTQNNEDKITKASYEYDDYGNQRRVYSYGDVNVRGDERESVTEYSYNTLDWIVAMPKRVLLKDKEAKIVSEKRFYYDNQNTNRDAAPTKGLLTKEEAVGFSPLSANTYLPTATYVYDVFGNMVLSSDALGRSTFTAYDTLTSSYPVSVQNAAGHRLDTVYYGINEPGQDRVKGKGVFGQVKSVQDANGKRIYSTYDELGRVKTVIRENDSEDNPQAEYEYDLTARPIKVTKRVKQEIGNQKKEPISNYDFMDGVGRVILSKAEAKEDRITKRKKQVVLGVTKYDDRGQVTEKHLPYYVDATSAYAAPTYATPSSKAEYDAIGRLSKTINPDGTQSTISYTGWSRTITDENEHKKTEHYDAYGNIVRIDEYNASQIYTTGYEYDASNNLTRVVDHQGNSTQIWYDSLGRKVGMDDPDMGSWSYEYDLAGNLVKQTDAKGQTLSFEYDELNRLRNKKAGVVGGAATTETLAAYIYDDPGKPNSIGRLSKVVDRSGSTEFYYDILGREIRSVKVIRGKAYTVERAYDSLDRLAILKYPDNTLIQYEHSPQGIIGVTNITDASKPIEIISDIEYSQTGQITKILYGNGIETDYVYNPLTLRINNVRTFNVKNPTIFLQDFNYIFDSVGNITYISDGVRQQSQQFVYDDLNRLRYAYGPYGEMTYGYDAIGNMLYKDGMVLEYGKERRFPHGVTTYTGPDGMRRTIDYDSNGNMVRKDETQYLYDAENRLRQVVAAKPKEPATKTLNIRLHPGWNFFTLPGDTALGTNIALILNPIIGKYDQVSRYNADTKKYEHYVADEKYREFEKFEYGKGYQIHVTAQEGTVVTFTVTKPEQDVSLGLKTGWNLVGNPYKSEVGIEEALLPLKLGVDYSIVKKYDPNQGKLLEYSQNKKNVASVAAGESFYVYCLKDVDWLVGSGQGQTNPKITTSFVYDGDGGRVMKAIQVDSEPTHLTTYIGSLYETTLAAGESASGGSEMTTKHIFAGANRIATIEGKEDGGESASTSDPHTKLDLDFEGNYGLQVNGRGNVKIDKQELKTGKGSALFDGNGDYLTAEDSDDWYFGNGDFTIDFWVRFNSFTNPQGICGQSVDANNYWAIFVGSDKKIYLRFLVNGISKGYYYTASAQSFSTGTWYHIAVERMTTTAKIFVDGISQSLTEDAAFGANDVTNLAAGLTIGRATPDNYDFSGWIDEFRLSKGIARWTGNFEPKKEESAGSAEDGEKTYYHHSDHLGSSNVITDEKGEQAGYTEFMPYGSVFKQSGAYDPKHKFTGKERDDSTGLYFYGARYMDPELGRFITPDTIVQAPYDPQSLNRYSYCRNNPINYMDPTGHLLQLIWAAAVVIAKLAAAHPFITGAILNVAFNTQNIHNFQSFATYAGIGALSGGIGAGIGGGIGSIAGGLGSFWGGLAGSAAGGFAYGGVGGFGNALAGGADFGTAFTSGLQTGAFVAATAGVLYTAGYGVSKVASAIKNANAQARAAGVKTPVGQQGKGSAGSSLNTNKGESASGSQALSSRGSEAGNSDYTDRIVVRKRFESSGYRYVGHGEASEAAKTGYVPNTTRTGDPKSVFYTLDEPLSSASQAQKVYNLETPPTYRIGLDTTKTTNTYGGAWGEGEGVVTELTTSEKIPVADIQKLGG